MRVPLISTAQHSACCPRQARTHAIKVAPQSPHTNRRRCPPPLLACSYRAGTYLHTNEPPG